MAVFKRIHQHSRYYRSYCSQQQASCGVHDKAHCIVEYGAGTGVFTRVVVAGKRRNTTYIVIEQNKRFYEILLKQFYAMPGVVLIHGDAGNVYGFLREQGFQHADYIISGLPFTSLPQQISHKILSQTQKAIRIEGVFTTFQYTLLRHSLYEYKILWSQRV